MVEYLKGEWEYLETEQKLEHDTLSVPRMLSVFPFLHPWP